jgi:hypothetical protein
VSDLLLIRPANYDPPAATVYLLDGHWSKLEHVYDRVLSAHSYHLIAQRGEFDLYRREQGGSTLEQAAQP